MNNSIYHRLKMCCGGRQKDIAKSLGVTEAAVSQWKKRGIPYRLGGVIEDLTSGIVTAKEISDSKQARTRF